MLTTAYASLKQAGNGVIVAFNFSFKILAATDLQVFKIDASGNQSSLLILGTDYTVTFDPIAESGTVTYTVAPVNGGFSLIQRKSDNTQQSSLPREGPMPAKTVETMIDKLTALIQELQVQQALLVVTSQTAISGTFAQLQTTAALNPSIPFTGIALDQRMIYVYLGNATLGASGNGFAAIGGY